MRMYRLESKNLAEAGYDPASKTLEVVFVNAPDLVYAYRRVSLMKFARLLTADSVGSFFEREIRSRTRRAGGWLHPFTKRKRV